MSKEEGGWNSSFGEKPVRFRLRRLRFGKHAALRPLAAGQKNNSQILVGDPREKKSSFDYDFRRPPAFLSERTNLARLCYLVGDIYLGTLVDPLIHAQETEPVPWFVDKSAIGSLPEASSKYVTVTLDADCFSVWMRTSVLLLRS
jgi:hypothetical protein